MVYFGVVGGGILLSAYNAREAFIDAGGGEAGSIAALKSLGFDVAMILVGGTAVKVGGKLVGPATAYLMQHVHNNPILSYAFKSAEKAVASGVGKVRAGAAHVVDKVGGAVSSSAVAKTGKVVAQKAEDIVAKAGQKFGKHKALDFVVPKRTKSLVNLVDGSVKDKLGWEHVVARHFNKNVNASQFTITQAELKALLQSEKVVKSPIVGRVLSKNPLVDGGYLYVRYVDVGRVIGKNKFNNFLPTSKISVLTDAKGNLGTVIPGRF